MPSVGEPVKPCKSSRSSEAHDKSAAFSDWRGSIFQGRDRSGDGSRLARTLAGMCPGPLEVRHDVNPMRVAGPPPFLAVTELLEHASRNRLPVKPLRRRQVVVHQGGLGAAHGSGAGINHQLMCSVVARLLLLRQSRYRSRVRLSSSSSLSSLKPSSRLQGLWLAAERGKGG